MKPVCENCTCENCSRILERRRLKKEGKKRCKKCQEIKQVEQFHIVKNEIRMPNCKTCRKIENRKMYLARLAKLPPKPPRVKKPKVKKPYIPTGRPVGRPKGSKNKIKKIKNDDEINDDDSLIDIPQEKIIN